MLAKLKKYVLNSLCLSKDRTRPNKTKLTDAELDELQDMIDSWPSSDKL